MAKTINRIGILTSGGDAPGMNAAIRAVVRASHYYGKDVSGIYRGYQGMIDGQIEKFEARMVSNIIHRGGTILKSARSNAFREPAGRQRAYEQVRSREIDALVVIGGNGTFAGAEKFSQEFQMPIIGIPGTIDNDLKGTDYTIGYDTATNTAVDAIDKIRDTASSHNRLFFIEVMGRFSGFIAVRAALAAGAEVVLVPEKESNIDEVVNTLKYSHKNFSLVIVAEGYKGGGAMHVARQVQERLGYFDSKVTILGHLQRGGSPSVFDRVLASRLGIAAVEQLIAGESGKMVGLINNRIAVTPFAEALNEGRQIDEEIWRITKILSI